MSAENVVATPLATVSRTAVAAVEEHVHRLCRHYAERLPFHGWHHVSFVRSKTVEFAEANGSDVHIAEIAALVHDLNYIVRRNSSAAAGRVLRLEILSIAGVNRAAAEWVDHIVREAEMRTRHRDISLEAQALSDADTLFKALPVTPVVLAHRYLAENGVTLRELANKIVGEQQEKHDAGYYFYNPEAAATYSRWAAANLQLWQCIKESLDDPTVAQLLKAVS
jgi:uncharacterized protein